VAIEAMVTAVLSFLDKKTLAFPGPFISFIDKIGLGVVE
jgi:hypothetical protein